MLSRYQPYADICGLFDAPIHAPECIFAPKFAPKIGTRNSEFFYFSRRFPDLKRPCLQPGALGGESASNDL